MSTSEYVFPQWFASLPPGIAFIYMFNTVVQISKDSQEELDELVTYYVKFPQEQPDLDHVEEFKKELEYMVNLCILCDGYDPTIEDLHLAYDTVVEFCKN